MFYLLNWKLWVAAALAGGLAFTHVYVYRTGAKHVRLEWQAATAVANIEAFKLSELRQRNVDDAARVAAARTNRLALDARGARGELERLRDAIRPAQPAGNQSCAGADQRAATAEKLLVESGELLTEIAGAADRHASDVRLLIDAWPK